MPGMLYLVPTPIGNLGDISQRCRETLENADFIAAEDTRVSLKLLNHLGIKKSLVSYYEHNKAFKGDKIVERILAGETCALVSDAGSPAISDPGEDLVALCAAEGVPVTGVPGCCAAIDALTLSGLPTARFCFEGFLSVNKSERRDQLARLSAETKTMLLHEAPHKLRATLSDLSAALGDERRIALCRELTKRNEDVMRCTIAEAIAHYRETEPRGEYVLVVEGGAPCQQSEFWQSMSVPEHVRHYLESGMKKNDAIKAAAHDRGVSKNEIYQQVLNM